MATLFEINPSNKTFIDMVVPDGEPCGCLNRRGCLDSMFCSCDCTNCLIQRRVDAGLTCYTCRVNCSSKCVELPDYEGECDYRHICNHCYNVYALNVGILFEIPEEEQEADTPDNLTEVSSITDYGADDQPDIDPDSEEEEMDEEERRHLWEMYWYRFDQCSSP